MSETASDIGELAIDLRLLQEEIRQLRDNVQALRNWISARDFNVPTQFIDPVGAVTTIPQTLSTFTPPWTELPETNRTLNQIHNAP